MIGQPAGGSVAEKVPEKADMLPLCERYAVADVDSHIIEPADLWTSRISSKWGDLVPHVRFHERRQEDLWYIGDRKLYGVGAFAQAQWPEFPPSHPKRLDQAIAPALDPVERLRYNDSVGVYMCWFERDSVRAVVRKLQDRLMFETDLPHATSLSPGPASESPSRQTRRTSWSSLSPACSTRSSARYSSIPPPSCTSSNRPRGAELDLHDRRGPWLAAGDPFGLPAGWQAGRCHHHCRWQETGATPPIHWPR